VPMRDSGDVEFGVKVTADGSVYVAGVKAAADATKELNDAVKKGGEAATEAGKAHESLTAGVFKGQAAFELAKRAVDSLIGAYDEVKQHSLEAQQAQTRLEAVLHATGGASGQTAESMGALADEMAKLTAFDDTQIKNAAASLATFDRVAGDAFPRVIKLSADLASTGRGDLLTWINILGRVGQEPVQAMGAFERVLGKIDPSMKTLIKNLSDAGDKQGALNTFLAIGESRAGGTAQESYRGLTRQVEGTKKAWDDLMRAMGNKIFDAQSHDASVWENTLKALTETVNNFSLSWEHLAKIQRSMQRTGPFFMFDMGARGEDRPNGGPNFASGLIKRPAPTAAVHKTPTVADLLTDEQQRALDNQRIEAERAYLDHVYQIRADGAQRSITLEGYRHDALLESDSDFFGKVAALEQQRVVDQLAKVQGEISLEKALLSNAGADLKAALGSEDPARVAAAQASIEAHRQKLLNLGLDLVATEQRWGDAEAKRAAAQTASDSKTLQDWVNLGRAMDDLQRSLNQQVDDLEQERDLTGQTEEQVRQANVARELAVKFDAERLKINRELEDLQGTKGNEQRVSDLQGALDALPDMFAKAVEKSRTVIGDIFSRKRSAELFSGLVGGLTDTFKAGWDAVVNRTGSAARAMRETFKRDFFDWLYAQFAKPFVLNVIASLAGGTGMGGIAQAATSGAGGNTIGTGLMNWLGSSAVGSYFSGAGQSFMAGYQGSALLAGGSTTDQLMNTFGQYVAEFGGYIMAATGIIAGVATSYGLYNGGWTGKPGTATLGMNDLGRVTGTPIWSPAGMIAGFTDRGLHGLGFSDRNAAILSGTTGIQRLFGWKDPHADAYGVSGNFGATDASGQNWQDMSRRGGLFRSDQRWTDTASFSPSQVGFFTQMMQPITDVVQGLSSLLGVNSSQALAGYSHPFNVQLSDNGKPRSDADLQKDFNDLLGKVLQEQVETILRSGGKGALADYVHNLQGAGSDIGNTVQAVLDLIKTTDDLGKTIKLLSDGPFEAIKDQMRALDDSVTTAGAAFDTALTGGDPAKILSAEQTLTSAIMNRYQTEMQMVQQLVQQIRAVEEAGYQFALNIAQRINAVGGHEDIPGLAMGRAGTLQSRVNAGTGSVGDRISDVQGYVGAIDTWYQARVSDINRDAQAQANAANAAMQQAAASAQSQAAALQTQLDLANQWNDVLGKSKQMMDDLRLSATNPLGIEGRTALAQGDLQDLMGRYQSATGQDKVSLANQVMDAAKTYSGLGQQAFQRPSAEWQGVYNEIQRDLTQINGDAKGPVEQMVDLQTKIAALQSQANAFASNTADATSAAQAGIDALNAGDAALLHVGAGARRCALHPAAAGGYRSVERDDWRHGGQSLRGRAQQGHARRIEGRQREDAEADRQRPRQPDRGRKRQRRHERARPRRRGQRRRSQREVDRGYQRAGRPEPRGCHPRQRHAHQARAGGGVVDRFAKYRAISDTLRGQICELELVTPLHMPDGSVQEVVNLRRAMCKKASRHGNVTVLEFADVDRSALEQLFPFETFKVADFPELFIDHVGKRVPQGVGTVVKVPMVWIQKSGGAWVYAGPKVLAGIPATLLAVYRGTSEGQGSVVSAGEYTSATRTAPSGITVNTINFTREQVDFNGRPYVIEADWLLPGSRTPSDEIARVLGLYGLAVDGASFATAAAADTAGGYFVDALYSDPGRTGNALLEDLLRIARGWLSQTPAGAWSIVQDVAKASSAQFDTSAKNDLCEVTEYGDGDVPKSVTLQYRTRVSGKDGDYTATLSRSSAGATGERQMKAPYLRDHTVADRLLSYWQKRLNTLRVARGRVFAQQIANGAVITITDAVNWLGTKDFIVSGVSRPADSNLLTLREYDAAVYVYTAAALPADATNVYSPDYSYTPPLAPTNVAVINQGTSADSDGKVTAFALIRATPPLVNWAKLMVQLTDTTTNEIYQAQLLLNPLNGTYEGTVSGLRPNRVHTGLVWAVNANNVDGVTTAIGAFTSANATTALAAPTVAAQQLQSFEVNVDLGAVADVAGQPKFRRYVLFEKVGAGAFAEVQRTPDRTIKRAVSHGVAYQWKAHSEDVNGNESADSATASLTPQPVITDSWITPVGITGTSIANSSINQGRQSVSSSSQSGTVGANSVVSVGGGVASDYSFAPGICAGGSGQIVATLALLLGPSSTQWSFYVRNNDPASIPYDSNWKQVHT
jgi:uncharacterized protein YoxC